MKKIMILFGKKNWINDVFQKNDTEDQTCYEYFYSLAEKNGIKLYRASYTWYDTKKNIFLYAWTFENNTWKRVYDIKPDLIYDKTKSTPHARQFKSHLIKKFNIINDIKFDELISNKLFTSLLFPTYSKKHHKASNVKELHAILKKIKTKKVVLKTAYGSGGKNVYIHNKTHITKNLPFPILAQEFIDSSDGIKGINESTHDLRLVFIENDLIYSNVKVPEKNSFLANISQGGSMKIVHADKLPKILIPLIADVQNTFSTFRNKIYTIDIMFDKEQRPWIIELNSMPGLFFSKDQYEERDRFYHALINLFKKTTTI